MRAPWGLLAAIVLLAGCTGPAAVPDGIPQDAGGRALPTVHGVVVDEAIRPVAGAEVRFLGTTVSTTTRDDGTYEIFEPITDAHAVLVTALKPGFIPRTQQVQVSGHQSARLDFGLEPNPSLVPRVEVLQYRGTLGCRATVLDRAVACNTPSLDEPIPQEHPSQWWLNPTPGLAGAVVEVDWDANSPFEESLDTLLFGPVAGGPNGVSGDFRAAAFGPSPLRLEVPEPVARAFPEWIAVVLEVSLPDGSATPVAVSNDQLYTAYATLFYVDPAPADYTLASQG